MKWKIPYKWELVFWLFVAFFFNQADRQIFNVLLLDIQRDLGLDPSQMGLVGTALILVNGLLLPVAGLAGDRLSKKWVITGALLFWSIATMLTGLSAGLPALILLRSVATGGGEAFYTPSANKLISENHPESTRATALSVHQAALYLGFIVSGVIATAIAGLWGWRRAFYVFGGAGVILALILALRLRPDAPSGKNEPVGMLMKDGLKAFFTSPTALLLAVAGAGFQFSGQAFLIWMPTCLQDGFAMSATRAAFDASFYPQAASIIGVLVGARLADKYISRNINARLWVQIAGFVSGAPFFYMIGAAQTETVVCVAMAGYGLFKGFYDSNLFASIYDVIDERYRAMATSFILMFSLIIASMSPYLLGVLKPLIGLDGGMKLMSLVYLVSSLPILVAALLRRRKVA